jgi:hypothetical protein
LPKISEERQGFLKNSGIENLNESIFGKGKEKSLLFPTLNKSKNSDFLFGSSNPKDQSLFSDKSQINLANFNKKDDSLTSERRDPFNFSEKNKMNTYNSYKNYNPILLPKKLEMNADRSKNSFYDKMNEKSNQNHTILEKGPNFNSNKVMDKKSLGFS